MSVISNNILAGSSGQGGGAGVSYAIERSLRFNPADSAYLDRTPASAGNSKTWTWAGWVKRSGVTAPQTILGARGRFASQAFVLQFGGSGYGANADALVIGHTYGAWKITSQLFRDYSAWYHIVAAFDSTNATASDRIKFYVNGVQITSFATDSPPALDFNFPINSTAGHRIGSYTSAAPQYLNAYLADVYLIDGQALDSTSFGEFDNNSVWQPKAYTGSYGTNGFHLPFSDNSSNAALGTDTSGNGNTWTVNNLQSDTGGPFSVASASGALPVYNTTDTYGTTKGTGTRTDSNSSSIVLALPMDGANNGTTFTDESATIKGSGSAKTVTVYGDTKTSTTQFKYYGSSGYFDGAGDYLTVPASSDFDFGTGDFTVEFWMYRTAVGNYATIISHNYGTNPNFLLQTSTSLGQRWKLYLSGISVSITEGSDHSLNTWHHYAIVRNGGGSNNVVIYRDGSSVATGSFTNNVGNATADYSIGGRGNGTLPFAGYIQDFRVYKGVAKYTATFNPPNSTQDTTIAVGCDSLVDSPTNGTETDTGVGAEVRGNYATLNPLILGSNIVLSDGNLKFTSGNTGYVNARSTVGVSSGKWYAEFEIVTSPCYIGIALGQLPTLSWVGNSIYGWVYHINGNIYHNNVVTSSSGASFTSGDIIGLAFDADNRTATWYKNGSSQGIYSLGSAAQAGDTFFFAGAAYVTDSYVVNFGQRPFAYTAPSGYKTLCTANLPTPTIADGSLYFDTKLYTGNGGTQSITGLGFSPDLVWIKSRAGTFNHALTDSVRGTGKELYSNLTNTETTFNVITALTSNGFSVSTQSGAYNATNWNSSAYAAWCWDAGSSTVSNTDGSITSQVRANASAGFSVCTFSITTTNSISTFGHGLGVSPEFVIIKPRNTTNAWAVFHAFSQASPLQGRLLLNETGAVYNYGYNVWSQSSTTLGVYSNILAAPGTAINCIAYCFAPVLGYSAMGSYTSQSGNNFVYVGFRPKFLLVKKTAATADNAYEGWIIFDSERGSYNINQESLFANSSQAEGLRGNGSSSIPSTFGVDFLSNGFAFKDSSTEYNRADPGTYIYYAVAENPFNLARAR